LDALENIEWFPAVVNLISCFTILSYNCPKYCSLSVWPITKISTMNYQRGKGKRERGKGKRERGKGKREKGQGTRDKGQGTRDKGQGTRDKGQGTRDKGQGTRDKGQGTRDKGQGTREMERKGGEEVPAAIPALFLINCCLVIFVFIFGLCASVFSIIKENDNTYAASVQELEREKYDKCRKIYNNTEIQR
jgi:hypothetical protein